MTPEQIATVIGTTITNVLTSGGLALFFFYLIKGLKYEIKTLNTTIEQQNKTLEVMEKQVLETEKLGNVYKKLVDDLPEFVEKYKKFINDSKDEVIAKLQQDQTADENVKSAREVELKRLDIQEQMVSELPKLRDELLSSVRAIEERLSMMPVYKPLGRFLKPANIKFYGGTEMSVEPNVITLRDLFGEPKSEENEDE